MKNNDFDALFREKLKGISPKYDPSSWDLLSGRLDDVIADNDPADDLGFDSTIRNKISNINVAYNPKHWSILSIRLDQMLAFKRNFYALKITEAIFMMLFLLLLLQFLPDQQKITPEIEPDPATIRNNSTKPYKQSGSAIAKQSDKTEGNTTTDNNGLVKQNSTSITTPDRSDDPINKSAVPVIQKTSAHSELANDFHINDAWSTPPLLSTPETINNFPPQLLLTPLARSQQKPTSLTKEKPMALRGGLADELPPSSAMGTFALLPSVMEELSSSIQRNTEIRLISPVQKKAGLRLGMFGSADFNRIVTPPDNRERRFSTTTRYAIGYSGGISLGFEKGRWEVETGAIYSAKFYNPPTVLYIFEGSVKEGGYTGAGLKYFELDALQIPLNFKYFFVYKNKWRVYAMTGASLSIINFARYYSASQDAFSTLNFIPALAPQFQNNNQKEPLPSELIKQVKDLESGWLEGGSFWENSYFTVNAGIGIERYFSNKFSLFVQPTYQQNFNLLPGLVTNEIGPNHDKFSTMSFYTGIRVRVTN